MIDLTSSLYLGLRHPSGALGGWPAFTTGHPAVLEEVSGTRAAAAGLAGLMGQPTALLTPSTLHLFTDLFAMLARQGAAFVVDAGAYPIARWGLERAGFLGAPVRALPHHDPDALHRLLAGWPFPGRTPVVVCDGFCVGCGRPAPLVQYALAARLRGGRLIIDDTQALGILGTRRPHAVPYGVGGGGTLRYLGLHDPAIVVGASLAKGFGVPLAVLAGDREFLHQFEQISETRLHCSPPSAVAVRAVRHALMVNRLHGELLRGRLYALVRTFRRRMSGAGFSLAPGVFPSQGIAGTDAGRLELARQQLERMAVRTVVQQERCRRRPRLACLLRADHTFADLARLARAITATSPVLMGGESWQGL